MAYTAKEVDEIVKHTRCPSCRAGMGDRCKTRHGSPYYDWVHTNRAGLYQGLVEQEEADKAASYDFVEQTVQSRLYVIEHVFPPNDPDALSAIESALDTLRSYGAAEVVSTRDLAMSFDDAADTLKKRSK